MTERGPGTKNEGSIAASYDAAQRAVDPLSDGGFPVEQVTGRRGYGQAAVQGAGSGALVGAFFGFVFGLFEPLVSSVVLAASGLVFGAIIGAIAGPASHAMSGGRRDFSSVGGMRAGRYSVAAAEEARRMLADPGVDPRGRAS